MFAKEVETSEGVVMPETDMNRLPDDDELTDLQTPVEVKTASEYTRSVSEEIRKTSDLLTGETQRPVRGELDLVSETPRPSSPSSLLVSPRTLWSLLILLLAARRTASRL